MSEDISLLNDSASLNILSKFSTFMVFQFSILPLNDVAPQNIPSRDVILAVSQVMYSLFPTLIFFVIISW
ncbi:Uncharacterised protein, partial [Mycoplasma putrefaciens]